MNYIERTAILLLLTATFSVSGQIAHHKRVSDIVLVNSTGQKCEVSQLISDLEECHPKVIGLNLLWINNESKPCDKELVEAIEASGKIILVEGLNNKLSDESFYVKALCAGETGLASQNGDITDFYYRIAEYRARYTFPFLIALQYDKSKQAQLASKSCPKHYPLKAVKVYERFTTLTPSEISKTCKIIKDKIILVGDLSSDSPDTHITNANGLKPIKINGTILHASVILEILKDLDTGDVKINPYSDMIRQKNLEKN